jgi:hypothetical protein
MWWRQIDKFSLVCGALLSVGFVILAAMERHWLFAFGAGAVGAVGFCFAYMAYRASKNRGSGKPQTPTINSGTPE